MDVVVVPLPSRKDAWSLKDRLGRELGSIVQSKDFVIWPEPASKLQGVSLVHPTLDAAMTAIETHMAGACSLDSRDRG